MKNAVAAAMGAVLLASGVGAAEAERDEGRFVQDMKRTAYATNQHLAFSWRVAIINWLGGVPIVKDTEARASRREGWWGEPVPALPAAVVARAHAPRKEPAVSRPARRSAPNATATRTGP